VPALILNLAERGMFPVFDLDPVPESAARPSHQADVAKQVRAEIALLEWR